MSTQIRKMILKLLATNFRKAIERGKKAGEKEEFFKKFPTGQCGTASDLLAHYLINNGIDSIFYVSGCYYDYDNPFNKQNHAWLEVNNLIVDITADQFIYFDKPLQNNNPVYVGPMTAFYDLLDLEKQGKTKHNGLEKEWNNYFELKLLFEKIMSYI